MLKKRILVATAIIPLAMVMITAGGWLFNLFIIAILGVAAWEFDRIYRHGVYHPARILLILGTGALAFGRALFGFQYADVILTALILAAMAVHAIQYERGKTQTPASDFAITLGGLLYLGWLGSYLISLRTLPDGMWWLLATVPVVALGDGGAYFIGSRFGKHKMAPVISPNKSWEGFAGGVITTILGGALLGALWHIRVPVITAGRGALIGLILGMLSPLGDLGESMIKRQFGVKDSSNLLPGHGGIMDRIDSWLWAASLGYYLIVFLWA